MSNMLAFFKGNQMKFQSSVDPLFLPKQSLLIIAHLIFHTFCSTCNYPDHLFLLQIANSEAHNLRIIYHSGNLVGTSFYEYFLQLPEEVQRSLYLNFCVVIEESNKCHLRLKISIFIKYNCHLADKKDLPNNKETVSKSLSHFESNLIFKLES